MNLLEETPESYDDVMTSGLNFEMKKGVLLFYQFKKYIFFPFKIKIVTDNYCLNGFFVYI